MSSARHAHDFVWHRKCYSQFTDKNKIERLRKPKSVHSKEETAVMKPQILAGVHYDLRRAVQPVNWNLCLFCQSADQKARLISVMTKLMSDNILQAAHLDYKIYLRLAGVIDLIAAEAKYISGRRGRPHQPFFFSENWDKCSFVWYINLDRSFYRFVTMHACDGRTDGQNSHR